MNGYRGDQYLAQGLAQFTEGITRGLEEKKRQGQLAQALRRTLSIAYPDRKSEFDSAGLPDLQGILQGEAVKDQKQEQQLKTKQLTAHLEALAAEDKQRKAAIATQRQFAQPSPSASGVLAGNLMMARPQGPQPLDLQRFLQIAGEQGYALPPAAVMQAIQEGQPSSSMGPETLAALGMIPTGGQLLPNNKASINFGLPDPKVPPLQLPEGFQAKTITVDKTGQPSTSYSLPDATDAQKSLMSNASELAHQLDRFESTVKKYGNVEYWNPEGSAALGQLPYETAILYSKLVDPATAAREGEVASAKKFIIPTGLDTRNATTLASIENQKQELARRIKTTYSQSKQLPPNLPASFVNKYLPELKGKIKADAAVGEGLLQQARSALKAGKDPAAVKDLYRKLTGQDFPE